MQTFWLYTLSAIGLISGISLFAAGHKLRKSIERVARSYAPIGVKLKGLTVEISALRRFRANRKGRLEADSSNENEKEE